MEDGGRIPPSSVGGYMYLTIWDSALRDGIQLLSSRALDLTCTDLIQPFQSHMMITPSAYERM